MGHYNAFNIDKIVLEKAWEELLEKYSIGDKVEGIIDAKPTFGAFVDIGDKFPAQLEIIDIINLDYDDYLSNKVYNIGDKVAGYIIGFSKHNYQIRISEYTLEELTERHDNLKKLIDEKDKVGERPSREEIGKVPRGGRA